MSEGFREISERLRDGKYNLQSKLRGRKRDDKEDRNTVAKLLERVAFVTRARYSQTQEGKS